LNPSITNTGSVDLTVNSILVSNENYPSASLNDFKVGGIPTPFVLKAGATQVIPVTFTPTGIYNNAVLLLKVETNSVTIPRLQTNLTVNSTFDKFTSTGKLVVKDGKTRIVPGTKEAVTYTVELNRTKAIADATNLTFKVAVTYELNFLGSPKIAMSSALQSAGYTMSTPERKVITTPNGDKEIITLTFSTNGDPLFKQSGNIDIATITFDAFLPYYKDSEGNLALKGKNTIISHEFLPNGETCLIVDGNKNSADLDSTCVDALRPIQISASFYGLQQVNPNPVGSNGGEIKFSVGGKNINTEIKIFNESGKLVSTVFNQILNSGEYSVRIPIEEMSSGVYFYKMTAGPYTSEAKSLVVQK
jgi:hypothetical protein